jgi:hypothetical protein
MLCFLMVKDSSCFFVCTIIIAIVILFLVFVFTDLISKRNNNNLKVCNKELRI